MFAACCCTEENQGEAVVVDVQDALEEGPVPVAQLQVHKEEEKPVPTPVPVAPPKVIEEPPKRVEVPPKVEVATNDVGLPHYFTIQVQKEDGPLGVMLDIKSHCVVVTNVSDGTIKQWNEKAPTQDQLRMHDMITAINEKTHKEAMIKEVQEAKGTVVLKVARMKPWTVKISKGDKPFGAALRYDVASCSMDVKEIRDGALKDFNKVAKDDEIIKVDDFITSVNGCESKPETMLELLKNAGTLEVTLVRPPPRSK